MSIKDLEDKRAMALHKWSSLKASDPAKKFAHDELLRVENEIARAKFGVDFESMSEQDIIDGLC